MMMLWYLLKILSLFKGINEVLCTVNEDGDLLIALKHLFLNV